MDISVNGGSFVEMRPKLSDSYHARLRELITALGDGDNGALAGDISVAHAEAVRMRAKGLKATDLLPAHRYLTTLLLLRDLVEQQWTVRPTDGHLELGAPSELFSNVASSDRAVVKAKLRKAGDASRRRQFTSRSVRKFIFDMERKGIGELFADGHELIERLAGASALPSEEREPALKELVRPELELVRPGKRDRRSSLSLRDVWRYCRLYWSMPSQSAPGRSLFYLVRDGGHPSRPVMGIAALGNTPVQITVRDDAIGWSLKATIQRIEELEDREEAERIAISLWKALEASIDEVASQDLVDPETIADPSEGTIRALQHIQKTSYSARRELLKEDQKPEEEVFLQRLKAVSGKAQMSKVDWGRVCSTHLYRSKRAGALADYLFAKLVFREHRLLDNPLVGLRELAAQPRGARALSIAVRANKKRKIGSNMMEITVCGAVPPYNDLLVGKLVAMLMVSPQVIHDYGEAYKSRPSVIASGMKGSPVTRSPDLVYLGTSSLYWVGSSQYNRVRVPGSVAGAQGQVVFRKVGHTRSYGTVHFSEQTAAALAALVELSAGMRSVNNIFGEGTSPKLRRIRAGLNDLGLSADDFLQHYNPKIVYAIRLTHNADAYLRGEDDSTHYILPQENPETTTRAIADFWTSRWLVNRIARTEVQDRVRRLRRDDLMLSRELVADEASVAKLFDYLSLASPESEAGNGSSSISEDAQGVEFVRRLYRSGNSYADRLTAEEIDAIHIPSVLDELIPQYAGEGRHIVITGNPGDGKTHLIEKLRAVIAPHCAVFTDANAVADEELLQAWKEAYGNGTGFCIAINEWPLLRLYQQAPDFPPLEEAWRQVREALFYTGQPDGARHNVQVIDLSHRNHLAASMVRQSISALATEAVLGQRAGLPDVVRSNLGALQNERVLERLCTLLERVAHSGHHATMRQLNGLVAYLLTGGLRSEDLTRNAGSADLAYYNQLFSGEGPLFEAIRGSFDPADVADPIHDEALWMGTTAPDLWLEPEASALAPAATNGVQTNQVFRSLKRRFFFEHQDGVDLLTLAPQEEREFHNLMSGCEADAPRLVRYVILAINRFFSPRSGSADDSELYLWMTHRYDIQAPTAYLALRSVGYRQFETHLPKQAPWLAAWMGDSVPFLPQRFGYVSGTVDSQALLEVDLDLYLTLRDADKGFSSSVWSQSAVRRIVKFIGNLDRIHASPQQIEDMRLRSVKLAEDLAFKVDTRVPPRYEL